MGHLRHQKYINKRLKNSTMNDMDKFEKTEVTKRRTFNKNWNDWYDWLINYIPDPIKTRRRD